MSENPQKSAGASHPTYSPGARPPTTLTPRREFSKSNEQDRNKNAVSLGIPGWEASRSCAQVEKARHLGVPGADARDPAKDLFARLTRLTAYGGCIRRRRMVLGGRAEPLRLVN